jgi:hypothetical protein
MGIAGALMGKAGAFSGIAGALLGIAGASTRHNRLKSLQDFSIDS